HPQAAHRHPPADPEDDRGAQQGAEPAAGGGHQDPGHQRRLSFHIRRPCFAPGSESEPTRGTAGQPGGGGGRSGWTMANNTATHTAPETGTGTPPPRVTELKDKIAVPVVDRTGADKGTVEIDPAAFGGKISRQLMHEAVLMYLANQRAGTHSTLRRGQ